MMNTVINILQHGTYIFFKAIYHFDQWSMNCWKGQLVDTDVVHFLCLIVLYHIDSFHRKYPLLLGVIILFLLRVYWSIRRVLHARSKWTPLHCVCGVQTASNWETTVLHHDFLHFHWHREPFGGGIPKVSFSRLVLHV